MSSQQQKPSGLPNPYAGGGLPNPYALPKAAPAQATEDQTKSEEKKTTVKQQFHNPHAIKRPQAKSATTIRKPNVMRPAMPAVVPTPAASAQQQPPKEAPPSLDYFLSTVEDDNAVLEAKREAERENKRARKEKKNFEKQFGEYNGSAPYDITKPTNLKAYKASGDRAEHDRLFRQFLQKARDEANAAKYPPKTDQEEVSKERYNEGSNDHSNEDDNDRANGGYKDRHSEGSGEPMAIDTLEEARPSTALTNDAENIAPYERRPRVIQDPPEQSQDQVSEESHLDHTPFEPINLSEQAAPPITQGQPSVDEARLKLIQAKQRAQELAAAIALPPAQPREQHVQVSHPPPPPPMQNVITSSAPVRSSVEISAPPVHYGQQNISSASTQSGLIISAPPVHYDRPTVSSATGLYTISAPPVHYARPDVEMKGADEPAPPPKKQKRQEKPVKPSKGALMMEKMGYKKGQGLGKNNDGIITHLEVKRRKEAKTNRRLDDFDNNGWGGNALQPQPVFDITGGQQERVKEETKWGEPSRIVVAWGCVDDVDFAQDAEREDGGIRQDMGEILGKKFGTLERIFINMASDPKPVYMAFKDPLSALNVVNRISEGSFTFRGKNLRAHFYNEERFNNFDYEH